MDAVILARIQFAFTIGFHFLFVPLSLGLSLFLVMAERRYYRTRSEADRNAAHFWLKLFTATFAIGVATGITMEFAFGTNWAAYSRFVGDIFGAPLAAEALFSFFLESTFLGVLLFGRKKVSPRFYYVSAILVTLGAHLSALWILIANSWQQTPAGYEIQDGRAVLTDFFAAALNDSTIPRFLHTVSATWAAGAFMAAGIAAYYLLKGRHLPFARRTMGAALVFGLAVTAVIPVIGHFHAEQVIATQPVKMAAYEGQFQAAKADDLVIWGWIDETAGELKYPIAVPGLMGLLTGGKQIAGLNDVAPPDRPPLQLTFQSYHLMVLVGMYLAGVMALGLLLKLTNRLETSRWFLWLLVISAPLPILGSELGWIAAEVGRQPWIVHDLLRTSDAISPVVPAGQIAFTLAMFAVVYALLFVVFLRVFLGVIAGGPSSGGEPAFDEEPGPSGGPDDANRALPVGA
ncbi:MAG TPA: cytochrome ubiquinol oxidase subunit I [Thermoleophilia bacterium]|nr:cytochrome ubiquinol oxidase subunit I [Thermoleophilia bacterium]